MAHDGLESNMRRCYVAAFSAVVLILASCSTSGNRSPHNASATPRSQPSRTIAQPTPTISLTSMIIQQAANTAATATAAARDRELIEIDDAEHKWRGLNIT